MVIDTSALMAILLEEPEAERLSRAMRLAPARRISAPTIVEVGLVARGRLGDRDRPALERLFDHLELQVIPCTEVHASLALEGYRRYGRGHHRAGLNFGDCFSYALAKVLTEPLLFVGRDFSRTDVLIADY